MPITDSLISPDQMTVLKQACQSRRKFHFTQGVEPFGNFTILPEATILEIIRTVRDQYYDCAELYTFADGNRYVVGWRKKAPLAISSALGTVTENQPFQLAPHIIEMAKARIEPQAQWNIGRGERVGFGVAAGVFLVLAGLAYIFGVEPRGMGTAIFFMALTLIMLAFPFVLRPWSNRNARIRTCRALYKMAAA
ncbi:hypothetical protein HYW59_04305 [Candidatus Kaiserbacteria bacterium]|nr:hypothetical protein [Candidatus Kaiserbacteria bacterium]